MTVYILRHAVAENRRPGLTDSKRELTGQGRKELRRVALGLRKLKVRPGLILSSRYRRAWDTALVAAEVLGKSAQVVEFAGLEPSGNATTIWTELRKHSSSGSVMVVGHEPLLTELAAYLLASPGLELKLKKSGFIRIEVDDVEVKQPAGELRWLLAPEHF